MTQLWNTICHHILIRLVELVRTTGKFAFFFIKREKLNLFTSLKLIIKISSE